MIKKILFIFILTQTIFAINIYSSQNNASFRFLDNLHFAEWKEFSSYNISPYFAQIIENNSLIIDEVIDNREFRYANDSGGDGTSEHWFYKPKYNMYLPDILHPPPEFVVKKDGRKLVYKHFLLSYKTPVDRWDIDENGFYVTVPDSNRQKRPEGKYTVSYVSFIKEEHSIMNYKYSSKIPSDFFRKYLTISDDTRDCLYLPAPSEIKFMFEIKKNAIFSFSFGIIPGYWYKESDGAIFEIYIKDKSNPNTEKIYEKDIDISNNSNHKWFDYAIDLKEYEGQNVEITFRTNPKFDKTFDYCAIANPIIYQGKKDYKTNKNVILISIDTLRADNVGAYGYSRNTTPFIDKFSKDSTTFKRCIAQSSWTLPSHMSMFTSKISSEHGVWDSNVILDRHNITFTEILHNEGYTTQGFVTHKFLATEYGFHKGFESYVYNQDEKADKVSKKAIDWISKNKNKPFFLFLHYFDPHFDYKPPEPYNKRFDPDYKGKILGSLGYLYKYSDPRNKIPPEDLEHLKALYDGEILFADKGIGIFIRGLQKLEILDNTMIIITSDHGEEFKDHNSMLHGMTLFEEQLLVPLIIHTPDCVPGIIDTQVESIDIAPTILDFLDLMPLSSFQGQNLYSFLDGKEDSTGYKKIPAFSESKRFGPYRVSATTPNEKYFCIFAGAYNDVKFFDLKKDPRELENRLVFEYERAEGLRNIIAYKVPNYSVERNWYIEYFSLNKDDVFEIEVKGNSAFEILKKVNISSTDDEFIHNKNSIRIVSKKVNRKKLICFTLKEFSSTFDIKLKINGIIEKDRIRIGNLKLEDIEYPIKIRQDFVKEYKYNVKPSRVSLKDGGFMIWCETDFKFVLSPKAEEKTKKIFLDGDSIELLKSLGYLQ